MTPRLFICSIEPTGKEFFSRSLEKWTPRFVDNLSEVPPSAEVLCIFIEDRITSAFLTTHPGIRLIVSRSTGCDHIDLDACKSAGIEIANANDYMENSVVEHTFALMLSLTRRIRACIMARSTGRFSRERLRGTDLRGKALGIVGTGRIGVRAAALGRAFGMKVLAADPKPNPFYSDLVDFEYVPLDTLFAESDVISLHAPLTRETHHILDANALAKCRPGVFIINTARGALIDTKALDDAIESGRVAGAGLDVLEVEEVLRADAKKILGSQIIERMRSADTREFEPGMATRVEEIEAILQQHALLSREEVVFTPHIAFNTYEAVERIYTTCIEAIEDYFEGQPSRHDVQI